MKKLAIGLALLLSACNNTKPQGADGYTFGTKQYQQNNVQITVVTYSSEQELQKAATRYKTNNIAAFSVLTPPFDKCTIHMIDPAVSYQPEFVGHEFLHCVYGQWHTDNASRS
jgi:hypothetical protein